MTKCKIVATLYGMFSDALKQSPNVCNRTFLMFVYMEL